MDLLSSPLITLAGFTFVDSRCVAVVGDAAGLFLGALAAKLKKNNVTDVLTASPKVTDVLTACHTLGNAMPPATWKSLAAFEGDAGWNTTSTVCAAVTAAIARPNAVARRKTLCGVPDDATTGLVAASWALWAPDLQLERHCAKKGTARPHTTVAGAWQRSILLGLYGK